MRFETPLALILLLLLPLAADPALRRRLMPKKLLAGLRIGEASPSLNFACPVPLNPLPLSRKARYRPAILTAVNAMAFCCLVLALARPQMGVDFIETETGGRDIMLVLDTSGSMQALDFFLEEERVRRLDALKHVVKRFIGDRAGDRAGLIVFGTDVYTLCPLTLDHSMVQTYLDGLEIGMAGDSTSLGEALALAVKRVRPIKAESKVIVLVTDGKQTSGTIDPLEAADAAAAMGIKVHAVGIGGKEPVPFKVRSIFGMETLEYREVPLDEATLQAVATRTGGTYFNATNMAELQKVYDDIDKLEERREQTMDFVEYEELYALPAILGLLLFIGAQLLNETVLRAIP